MNSDHVTKKKIKASNKHYGRKFFKWWGIGMAAVFTVSWVLSFLDSRYHFDEKISGIIYVLAFLVCFGVPMLKATLVFLDWAVDHDLIRKERGKKDKGNKKSTVIPDK